jgi:hypothetical protein
LRVLLSEASSLTAREHLSVLGPTGMDIGVATSNRLAIARFSRWCHHTVRVPRGAGVRTHSSLALMLGAAERSGSRAAAAQALATGLGRRNELRGSREVLTPLPADPPSLIPVLFVASQLMLRPRRAQALAAAAVRDYAMPPGAVNVVRV